MTRVAIGGLTYEGACTDAANARYDADAVRAAVADEVPERDIDAGVHVALTLLARGDLALDGDALRLADGVDGEPRALALDRLDDLDLAADPDAAEDAVRVGMVRLHAVLVGVYAAAASSSSSSSAPH